MGETGQERVHKCDWCGAENPRWLKWQDNGPLDYGWRKIYGMPGPTATPLRACDEHKKHLDPASRLDYPDE